MNPTADLLKELLGRIPRRHSADNIKEINTIIGQYENVLMEIESVNDYYEKNSAVYFEHLDQARQAVKKSADNKASKKNKDEYFGDASGGLKESIESLITMFGDGKKTG